MKAASLLFVLFALPAAAQITLQVNGRERVNVSPASCDGTVQVSWNVVNTGTPCTSMVVWATSGSSCGDVRAEGELEIASVDTSTLVTVPTGQQDFDVADLPIFTATSGAIACGAPDVERDHRICAAYKTSTISGCETVVKASSAPIVRYDSKAPGAPTLEDVVPLDGALSVRASGTSDTEVIQIQVRDASTTEDFVTRGEFATDQSGVRISNLFNDTVYEIRAVAVDGSGNASPPSAVVQGKPVASEGFFGAYLRAGGDPGGCSAATSFPSLLALGFSLLLFRRFTR